LQSKIIAIVLTHDPGRDSKCTHSPCPYTADLLFKSLHHLISGLLLCIALAVFGLQSPMAQADTNSKALPVYDLAVKILPEAHRLEASGSLRLAPYGEARQFVQIGLSDLMQNLEAEFLEPRACAGQARIEKARESNKTIVWKLAPPKEIPAGEAVRLRFSYAGGGAIRFVFYIGEEGSFAGGFNTLWYPQVESSPNTAAKSTGVLRFSVPKDYQVIATGSKRSLPEEEASGAFRFDVTQPSMFTFAAAKYTVEHRLSSTGVPTSAYLLRRRPKIGDYLENCARVLDILTQEFGPSPYREFALVEVPTEQASKADFAGASFEGFIFSNAEFLDQDFNTAYYGHEISHQWWGVSVGRKGARGNMMLSEALAQYGSLRAVELLEGSRAAERYRRSGYPGYIVMQNATGYFMVEAGGFDQALANLQQGQFTRILADGKGFIVYDMLARTIGREKFSRILQRIAREYAADNISWEEFLQAIENGAGMSLKWFYDQWFERKGAPEWDVTWQQDGNTVRGAISQPSPYFRARVEILLEGDEYQASVQNVELQSARTEFSFPAKFRVRALTVDPHYLVLHRTPPLRALKAAMGAHIQASVERNKKQFEAAEKILRDALEKATDPDPYGARFTLQVSLGQVFLEQKRFAEAKASLQAALANPGRRAEVLPRAYLYLAQAAKGLQDETVLNFAVNSAIAAEAAIGGSDVSNEARRLLAK
jgi:aminopeptidase N